MDNCKKNTFFTKEEKLIVTLFYIAGSIVVLGIGYLIATAFIEFPWEKNVATVSSGEFEVRLLSISNKIFFFTGIIGGSIICFNLTRYVINKLAKRTPRSKNAKLGIVDGSIVLTASYLAYFLTNYEPGHSSGNNESKGILAAILLLSIIVMSMLRRKQNSQT